MSQGQRAKVILAKLLLEKPDVLLLDEPTNFLDKEHVEWLGGYLSAIENAFMVVSHDRTFLERICTRICDIDNGRLSKYYGSYTEFLKRRHFCARTIYVSTMRSKKKSKNRRFHTEEHSRPESPDGPRTAEAAGPYG